MTTFAPQNIYPEAQRNVFERKMAPSIPGNRGPLRFEEGIATETDVPSDFQLGAYGDTAGDGRGHQTAEPMFYKHAAETMRERAHIGSASWIESPEVLGDFVQGTSAGDNRPSFEYAYNSGMHQERPNIATVSG
jgi:hypothetical protein